MTAMTPSAYVICPCGCEAAVAIDMGGFSSTTIEVEACPTQAARGIESYTMRKSAGLALQSVAAPTYVRHVDGLVVLG